MKQGWEYKKLRDICNVINGLWTGKKEPFINVAVIRNTNFSKDCQLNLENVAYIDVEAKQFASRKLLCGDIIIEKSGGSEKQPVGRPILFNISDGDYSFSNFTSTLRIKENAKVDSSFLHKCLYAFYLKGETFKLQSKTTGLHNLNMKGYLRSTIPLPPKSTQLAIVSELDKINELIRLKKEQLKDYDNLAQIIFYEMFGDPVENDKGFDTKRLDEVFPLITDGTHQTPTYTEDRENGYKFLSAKDVTSGSINWNNVKFIPAWLHDNLSKRLKPQKNDILLCKNGTTGICALVEDDDTFDIYVSLALLRPNNLHNPKYLTYAINSPATKRQFDDSLKGIGVPNLHLKEIRRTIIIIPPLPLQQLFAQRIEQIEHQKSEVTKAITDLETLLASRMQYWFE